MPKNVIERSLPSFEAIKLASGRGYATGRFNVAAMFEDESFLGEERYH